MGEFPELFVFGGVMDRRTGESIQIRNPYVSQADRFAVSLKHMADTFLMMEEAKENFTKDEIREMCEGVSGKVCASCERRRECFERNREEVYQLVFELLDTIESYGVELNIETKRNLQKRCIRAPKFLRETLHVFQDAKQRMLWNNRIVQNRESCAVQLDTFAKMIQQATRELEASIFQDPPLEKKIRMQMKKSGIRMLSSVFFVNAHGRYEMHLTLKAEKGICATTRMAARILSTCTGRRMCPAQDERPVLGQEYGTLVFVEGPRYHILHGISRIGKECQQISGDNFVMLTLPGGQEAMVLSDGMGSGERASQESAMIVEMLEELLQAGFPPETALQMMNTALVMGREEVCFSTVDISCFDLYAGECRFLKAGASTTFIRKKDRMEHIYSGSLPLGVVPRQVMEDTRRTLEVGDVIVMLTDGVMDALPPGRQEELLDLIISGTSIENPKELAHYILEKVLELSSGEPKDDMTILVAGIWEV